MRRLLAAALLVFLTSGAQRPPEEGVRFRPIDVFVDAGDAPLAAYQVEIASSSPDARIVGVEGGESQQYAAAPYYDPAALQGGRIIIAAFTTEAEPPSGRTRVARIHMQEAAGAEPAYTARLMAAAAPGGGGIEAKVEPVPSGGQR